MTHWLFTIDTSDQAEPEKLFPNKEHLYWVTQFWLRYPTLLIPKSRQMSMTWLCCALYLWESFFFSHRLTFFQSKKEGDANELTLRAAQMYSSLPWWMQEWNPMQSVRCYMEFGTSKSRIFGVPSGADQIRGYQPSGLFNDETVYQTDVDKMIAAIRPAIRGGGRLTMTSSCGPSYFANMIMDALG